MGEARGLRDCTVLHTFEERYMGANIGQGAR